MKQKLWGFKYNLIWRFLTKLTQPEIFKNSLWKEEREKKLWHPFSRHELPLKKFFLLVYLTFSIIFCADLRFLIYISSESNFNVLSDGIKIYSIGFKRYEVIHHHILQLQSVEEYIIDRGNHAKALSTS